MKSLIFLSLISAFSVGYPQQPDVELGTEIANVDSVWTVIEQDSGKEEIEWGYTWIDSAHNVLHPRDLGSLNRFRGLGRTNRANFIDSLSIARVPVNRRRSRLTGYLNTWQIRFQAAFSSDSLLMAIESFQIKTADSTYHKFNWIHGNDIADRAYSFVSGGQLNAQMQLFDTAWIRNPNVHDNTVFYADAVNGNDANDGLSWANAEATLSAINGHNPAANDSIGLVGTFQEVWILDDDGTSGAGNQIVVRDSLSLVNGMNYSNPDTTNLWSATIDGEQNVQCLQIERDDFWNIGGINFIGATNRQVQFAAETDHSTLIQCRFNRHGDGTGSSDSFIALTTNSTGTVDSVISCFFSAVDTTMVLGISNQNDGDGHVWMDNTWVGNYSNEIINMNSMDGTLEWKNNILDNDATGGAVAIQINSDAVAAISDFDNNIYNSAGTNTFTFNGANFDLLATWVDSVNNYDADGEANAVLSDPVTQSNTTTGFIDTDSPAFGIAEDSIFNDASDPSAGWYQPVATTGVRRRWIIISRYNPTEGTER